MVDEAKVADQPQADEAQPPRPTLGRLASTLAALAELQWRLVSVDTREALGRLIAPLVLAAAALCVALAAAAVLLVAAAWGFVEGAGWPRWLGFLSAGLIGLLLCSLLLVMAVLLVRRCCDVFQRSRDELAQNLRWVKESFSHAASPEPHDQPPTADS